MNAESKPVAVAPVEAEASFTFSPTLVMINDPASGTAEAIRALRTHLMAQHLKEGRRALAVCGASEGVGCSFIAANLAVAFCQIGIKTLYIDGDLRKPAGEQLFGYSGPRTGLAFCLTDAEAFSRQVHHEVQPNLSVMFAGGIPASPQELLASDRFQTLMEFCLREYDLTLVDTPPANTCSDARRISTVAGYSLIVARRNLSYVGDVKALAAQLEADHSRVVGSVLNEA